MKGNGGGFGVNTLNSFSIVSGTSGVSPLVYLTFWGYRLQGLQF